MQWPGLTQEAPAAFLEIQTLTAVIGFMNQLLLNQPPRQPSPVRRTTFFSIESFTQSAGICAMNLRQQPQNSRGLVRPVLL